MTTTTSNLVYYTTSMFWETERDFLTCNEDKIVERCENNLPTYEVLNREDYKYKLYLDIDCKVEKYEDINNFNEDCQMIEDYGMKYIGDNIKYMMACNSMPDFDPIISMATSHSNSFIEFKTKKETSKISVRYFISNLRAIKSQQLNFVSRMNAYCASKKPNTEIWEIIELKDKLFDTSIYDTNRKMRCVGTSKPNENRPLVLKFENTKDTIITLGFSDNVEEMPELEPYENPSQKESTCSLSLTNPKYNYSNSPNSVTLTLEEESMSDIDYLLCICIQDNMCKEATNHEWTIIGQALKNDMGDDGIKPFINWTYNFGTENKKKEAYDQITKHIKMNKSSKDKKKVTIATIHFYARKYNEEKYVARFCKKMSINTDDDAIMQELSDTVSEYKCATVFCKFWGSNFKCVDVKNKIMYGFNKNALWEQFESGTRIREMISNELSQKVDSFIANRKSDLDSINKHTDEYKYCLEIIQVMTTCKINLERTTFKDHVFREIMDITMDSKFEEVLNKSKYLLPIKNKKIINVKTLEITDRTIDHRFTYECNADYVNMTEEQENDIKTYFLELFCGREDTMKCVINILKSMVSGEKLRYIFFFTGEGSNGKSLLFTLLQSIFKSAMDTIDTKVILKTKSSSSLTTEYEKLDKVRCGYVTELQETDELNTPIIKKISGNDPIDYRGLYKGNKTVMPTCNLGVLTNKLPHFDVEKAILNRIIVIPFKNTFQVNNTKEAEMMGKLDFIFTYIMKHGVVQDKFDLTDEMMVAMENYKNDNVKLDYMKDFIKTSYDIVPFVKIEKVKRDDFRLAYNAYLQQRKEPVDKSSNQKFSRMVQSYNIGIKESNGNTYYTGIIPKQLDEEDEE